VLQSFAPPSFQQLNGVLAIAGIDIVACGVFQPIISSGDQSHTDWQSVDWLRELIHPRCGSEDADLRVFKDITELGFTALQCFFCLYG